MSQGECRRGCALISAYLRSAAPARSQADRRQGAEGGLPHRWTDELRQRMG